MREDVLGELPYPLSLFMVNLYGQTLSRYAVDLELPSPFGQVSTNEVANPTAMISGQNTT